MHSYSYRVDLPDRVHHPLSPHACHHRVTGTSRDPGQHTRRVRDRSRRHGDVGSRTRARMRAHDPS